MDERYEKLWQSIIAQACVDYLDREPQIHNQARDWLEGAACGRFSFETVCQHLGVNAERMQRLLLGRLDNLKSKLAAKGRREKRGTHDVRICPTWEKNYRS